MATAPFWISRSPFRASLPALRRAPRASASRPAASRRDRARSREALDVEQMSGMSATGPISSRAPSSPTAFLSPASRSRRRGIFPRARDRCSSPSGKAPRRRAAADRAVSDSPPGFSLGAATTRGWLHKQAALATPLLDRDCAEEAAAALVDWLAAHAPASGAILFPRCRSRGRPSRR